MKIKINTMLKLIYLVILLTFTSCIVQDFHKKYYDYDCIEIIIKANIGDTVYCEIRKMEEGIFYSFNNQDSSYYGFTESHISNKNILSLNGYIFSNHNKILKRKNLIKHSLDNENQNAIAIAINNRSDKIYVYKIDLKQQEELIRKILIALPEYPIELEQLLQSSFKHRKKPY
jgi:hypothetical protein